MSEANLLEALRASVARAREAAGLCPECLVGHDRGDGLCERHGKRVRRVAYVCKRCGAQSPPGIGYVADGQRRFPDPAAGCINPHV